MSLLDFYNTQDTTPFTKSDKGTTHDYIMGYYDKVFTPLKNKEFIQSEIKSDEQIGITKDEIQRIQALGKVKNYS